MTFALVNIALLITGLIVLGIRACFSLLLRSKGSVELGGW